MGGLPRGMDASNKIHICPRERRGLGYSSPPPPLNPLYTDRTLGGRHRSLEAKRATRTRTRRRASESMASRLDSFVFF